MAKEWGRFIESRAAREAVAQGVIEKIPQAEKAMDKIVMFMIDGAKAYGRIDDRLGTKLQPLIDKASTQNTCTPLCSVTTLPDQGPLRPCALPLDWTMREPLAYTLPSTRALQKASPPKRKPPSISTSPPSRNR